MSFRNFRHRAPRFLRRIGAVAFLLLLLVTVIREIIHGYTYRTNAQTINAEIDALSARATELAAGLVSASDPARLEAAARALGLGKPGEIEVILPKKQGNRASRAPSPKTPLSNWWSYFVQ